MERCATCIPSYGYGLFLCFGIIKKEISGVYTPSCSAIR